MKKKLIYLMTLILVGCSTTKQVSTENVVSESTNNPIEGSWILKNVLMGDAMDAPCGFSNEGKVKEINVTFTTEKINGTELRKLYGQSSVNSFSGNYSIQSYDEKNKTGRIQIDQLISTKMASVDSVIMECENRYFLYLQKAEDFKIVDGKLQLIKTHSLPKGDSTNNSPWGESYKNVLYFDKK